MSERLKKVNAMLSTEVGTALGIAISRPGTLLTVTAVETAPDLKQATVWVSVLPDSDAAWAEVEAARPSVQAHVAERVELKHTPRLTLARDRGPAHAQRINELLG